MQERPYHVIPVRGIPAHWKRVAGHDWGYGALCYTCWAAIDPDGGLIIYKELAGRQWSPSTIAGNIITVQGSDQVPVIWAGVDIWQEHRSRLSADQLAALKEKGLGQLSVADQYVRAGLKTMRPCPNLDRHSRKQRIHELLGPRADGRPYLRIMENCPVLIKTLEQIQLAKHDPEDVETTYAPTAEVRDDPYDGLGHMVMALPKLVLPAAPPPQTVKPYRPHIVEAPVGYQPAGAPLQVRWGGR